MSLLRFVVRCHPRCARFRSPIPCRRLPTCQLRLTLSSGPRSRSLHKQQASSSGSASNTACQIWDCGEEEDQAATYANRAIRRVAFDAPRKRQRKNQRYAVNPTIRTESRGGGSSLCPNELQVRPSASGMKGRLSGEEAGMVRTEWNVY